MKNHASLKHRFHWLNAPTLSLLALLQRTPVAPAAASAERLVLSSPIGAVLKSAAAFAGSLGAMNSLAGATPLSPSSGAASGLTVTAGTAVSVAFTVTPTQTPIRSWKVGGTIPAGLDFSGRTSAGTVNVQSLLLGGAATTAGTYALTLQAFDAVNAGGFASAVYNYTITVQPGAATAPAITAQPQNQGPAAGGTATLTVAASGSPAPGLQWRRNGVDVAGATNASLTLNAVQPGNTGLYAAVATNSAGSATTEVAIVGVLTALKVLGEGNVVGTDIPHPNGNIFDQVLVTGAAESITADSNQVTRTSYIDLDNDIVQVEFSGAGTLSLVLDNASGPAVPLNYNQPTVSYMKGHAGIVIVGANETTNVSVFTVGRATAFDPTGGFNILQSVSATNSPANNGSPLFQGHGATTYDGIADIAFIAIATTNGKFGGVRTANANYFASNGYTGVFAPGVAFQGPIRIGDISAFDAATPVIVVGSASDTLVTGGDMLQANGQPVRVSGLTQLKFVSGADSGGNALPAQANRATYQQNGADVTAQIVVNP